MLPKRSYDELLPLAHARTAAVTSAASATTPRDINIGANMDGTIHYFQDRTELKKSVFQYFQDSGECWRPQFPIFPGLE